MCSKNIQRIGYLLILEVLLVVILVVSGLPANAQSETDSTEPLPVASGLQVQKTQHWFLSGYLKDLQSVQFRDVNEHWTMDNLLHNRLDLRWYADSLWKIHVGIRNRLLYGESVPLYVQNPALLDNTRGLMDLSRVVASGESFLLHTTLDRASVDFTRGKWQVTAGRQRINWGLNLVWNPNDIFNAYTYFDFDYEERPGTDALRVQYYRNSTSSAELAWKPGRKPGQSILAGLYRFTTGSYDIQFLAGKALHDYVVGGGWSGVLGQAGFNGEYTFFIPDNTNGLAGTVASTSLGINYTFPGSLYLHGAWLLNTAGFSRADSINISTLFAQVSAKTLSPARHSALLEVAYQLSPLIRGDLSGIVDPNDGSFFLGPFFTFSLTNTMEFLAGGQLFFGSKESLFGDYGRFVFMRFKWSF